MDGIEATQMIMAGDGASGFLVKDMALEDILAAIRIVAAVDALIAPSVTRRPHRPVRR